MMDQDELLIFVARAYLRAFDEKAEFRIAELASEAGVEPYHVTSAIDELRARGWIEGHPAHGLRSTRDQTAMMRNFVNPLPKKKLSVDEAGAIVAQAFLARVRAEGKVHIDDLAADTSLGVGAVKRILKRWEDSGFGILPDGLGWIGWTADAIDYLEDIVADQVEWDADVASVEAHHHGDHVTGNTVSITIDGNSNVGAFAIGKNATATGTVTTGLNVAEEVKRALADARLALARAESSMSDEEYESFHQLLRIVRSTQIEVNDLLKVQRQMKSALDDLYASNKGEALRSGASRGAKEFAKVLAASPAFAELAKALLEGMGS